MNPAEAIGRVADALHALGLDDVVFVGGAVVGLNRRIVSAPYLIATKLEAFHDRGAGDVLFSRDLGDIVALVDGREELADEVRSAEAGVRGFIAEAFRTLLDDPAFVEAIPAHLMPDAASQARAPLIAERMRGIASASSRGHPDG